MADMNQILKYLAEYKQEGGDVAALDVAYTALFATGKTPLGLNQWVKTDKPMMEDFNEDNRIVDEKLRQLSAEKADKAVPYAWTPELRNQTGTAATPNYDATTAGYCYLEDDYVNYSFRIRITNFDTAGYSGSLVIPVDHAPLLDIGVGTIGGGVLSAGVSLDSFIVARGALLAQPGIRLSDGSTDVLTASRMRGAAQTISGRIRFKYK